MLEIHNQQTPDLRVGLLQYKRKACSRNTDTAITDSNEIPCLEQRLCALSNGITQLIRIRETDCRANHEEQYVLPLAPRVLFEERNRDSIWIWDRRGHAKGSMCTAAFERLAQRARKAFI